MKKIVKIKDKIESMDVIGQGVTCTDDCVKKVWHGNRNNNEIGCKRYSFETSHWTSAL